MGACPTASNDRVGLLRARTVAVGGDCPGSTHTAGLNDPVPRHRRNPRRAYDRDGREIRPMDLANAMQNGVRFIRAICPPPCRHEAELAIECFPSTMAVPDVGLLLRCSVCGRKGPETEPSWPQRDRA